MTTGTIDDSCGWIDILRGGSTAARANVLGQLHGFLLRATRFELSRRREQLVDVGPAEQDNLAVQAADDALMAILGKLDDFRGASRFTTWVYKFAVLEAGVKARRRAWHGREIPLDDEAWAALRAKGQTAQEVVDERELLRALRDAIRSTLTAHQREVFTAVALNGVPIDVLVERRSTTRGALYKTVHDARRELRAALSEAGHLIGASAPGGRDGCSPQARV